MKVLVSGATGFVGSAITRHLLSAGHDVRALTRSAERDREELGSLEEGRAALDEGRLTFVEANVREPRTLPPAVEGVDIVIQAAQFPGAPVEQPDKGWTYMEVDRNGTMNLLDAIAKVYRAETAGPGLTRYPEGSPRFIYQSGVTVTEHPSTHWDLAKWQAEEAIRGSGLEWSIVRCSPVYGPGDKSFNRLLGYSDFQPFVPLFGDGEERVTPVFIEDVGRLYLRLVEDEQSARDLTLPFGGPDEVSMNQMMETMLAVKGRKRWILHIPKPVGKAQGFVMQFLPGQILSPSAVDFASQGGTADPAELRRRLPEFPLTPLFEGLSTYLR